MGTKIKIQQEVNWHKLLLKYEKIKIMKKLLNINARAGNLTEEDLCANIQELAEQNPLGLITLNFYESEVPDKVRCFFNKLSDNINDKASFRRFINIYKLLLKTNQIFREFNDYILVHMSKEIMEQLNSQDCMNTQVVMQKALEAKTISLILLYRILAEECNDIVKFQTSDVLHNFPLLSLWIAKNKYKPIEELTCDECEVLAGLLYGLDYSGIIELNLSSGAKHFSVIDQIIKSLPEKFHVNNITQVIFRILLLKPFIWGLSSHKNIVDAIKGLRDVL